MATQIHPTAIIEDGAALDEGVIIGAYAYVGPHVKIGKGTEVMHHATVDGATTMGE
ncbi:MAG TPA: acyl-[acyl-carrier-protein]--UDP-N-acetylglucosamine O-acyltransferase, partial [Opitutae bacterium]|nr:acyl-[acyl-carrier-protein]--UDP-N-acetylglucosamine O-acyltransferase [Opitutae bacterium]